MPEKYLATTFHIQGERKVRVPALSFKILLVSIFNRSTARGHVYWIILDRSITSEESDRRIIIQIRRRIGLAM